MSWLAPLAGVRIKRKQPDNSRPVIVNGRWYRSLSFAAQRLGVSTTKLYRMMGER